MNLYISVRIHISRACPLYNASDITQRPLFPYQADIPTHALQAHKGGGVAPGPAEQRAAGSIPAAALHQRPPAHPASAAAANAPSSHDAHLPVPPQAPAQQGQAPAPASFSLGQQWSRIPW